jgi:hypothetical protein
LPEARERARRCTSSVAACTTDVVDECGCPFVVGQADSVAAADYKALAQQVRAAGCAVPGCGASCPTPRRGLCIVAEGGGTACAP